MLRQQPLCHRAKRKRISNIRRVVRASGRSRTRSSHRRGARLRCNARISSGVAVRRLARMVERRAAPALLDWPDGKHRRPPC
jgi:hypothetical protein